MWPPALAQDDCWVIIKGKVYDVTDYVDEHPGGKKILNNAGCEMILVPWLRVSPVRFRAAVHKLSGIFFRRGDSTTGFFGPQHPTRVFDIFDDFLIGELVETAKDK